MSGTTLFLFLSVAALMSFILIILGLLPQPNKGNKRDMKLTAWGTALAAATVVLYLLEPMLFSGSH
ncbi:hypothetical protein [Aneurinibacillus tyrosinisolvens]|jgi:hypothetical protein|uniref:hypothetical protein n=1 Tax=Aneurinibacillus tyrosinisolvens TaxID=1443435 RepID=UPI00063F6003|nr:hypothetical protein [Aneurinibacillus tyrosinisolvens]